MVEKDRLVDFLERMCVGVFFKLTPEAWKLVLLLAGMLAFPIAGCATIGPAAPTLSRQIGERLVDMRSAHEQAVRRYFEIERSRVERFVEERWIPTFLQNFVDTSKILPLLTQPGAAENPSGQLLIEWAREADVQIQKKRADLVEPLRIAEQMVLTDLSTAYAEIIAAQTLLTARLEAAADLKEQQDRALAALNADETFKDVKTRLADISLAIGAALAKAEGAPGADSAATLRESLNTEIQKVWNPRPPTHGTPSH